MSNHNTTPENASSTIEDIANNLVNGIGVQVKIRAYRVSNELTNSIAFVLRGQRSGKRYKIPGTFRRQRDKVTGNMRNGRYYTASAPGESPAVRTGAFRESWKRRVYAENGLIHAVSESDLKTKKGHLIGDILEKGTKDGRIAPRPYKEKVIERALPQIKRIYNEPYTR